MNIGGEKSMLIRTETWEVNKTFIGGKYLIVYDTFDAEPKRQRGERKCERLRRRHLHLPTLGPLNY